MRGTGAGVSRHKCPRLLASGDSRPQCDHLRRSLRSKCGLFQTENRRVKQKVPANPARGGHRSCKHGLPPGKHSRCSAKARCLGDRLACQESLAPCLVEAVTRERGTEAHVTVWIRGQHGWQGAGGVARPGWFCGAGYTLCSVAGTERWPAPGNPTRRLSKWG